MKSLAFLSILSILFSFTPAGALQSPAIGRDRVVTIATYNVYHGVDAELNAVATSSSFPALLTAVASVYNGYFARNFPERAAAIATEIEASQPALIGLQEAVLVRTQFPADGPVTPATDVALDFVQILLDELAGRGLHYSVVVESTGFDAELPSALGIDVRHTDRDVILARSDLNTSQLKLSNSQAGNFTTNCVIPSPSIGQITFLQGWAAVDVKIRGKSFRLVSTHLDAACLPFTSLIQQAQGAELLAGPAATDLPVVMIGDFNSDATSGGVTYSNLSAEGFSDAWLTAGAGPGLTCCQADDLLNGASSLNSRIDLILTRGDFGVLQATVIGDEQADRTPSGLWPSDHAGVVATLVLPQP